MNGGGGGGNDVELVPKTLQFDRKLFYFDVKENPRGRYLQISEKTSATTRSTIVVPLDGIVWILEMFDYFIDTDGQGTFHKELVVEFDVFHFDIGENKRGCFLEISEAFVKGNPSAIIVPAGSSGEGWAAFRNVLQEIQEELA